MERVAADWPSLLIAQWLWMDGSNKTVKVIRNFLQFANQVSCDREPGTLILTAAPSSPRAVGVEHATGVVLFNAPFFFADLHR
jgi:hypothetical protein